MNLTLVALEGKEGGIGAYAHQLRSALSSYSGLNLLPLIPEDHIIGCNGWLDCRQQYKRIGARLNRADIIHLQHQYFLFGGVARKLCQGFSGTPPPVPAVPPAPDEPDEPPNPPAPHWHAS